MARKVPVVRDVLMFCAGVSVDAVGCRGVKGMRSRGQVVGCLERTRVEVSLSMDNDNCMDHKEEFNTQLFS